MPALVVGVVLTLTAFLLTRLVSSRSEHRSATVTNGQRAGRIVCPYLSRFSPSPLYSFHSLISENGADVMRHMGVLMIFVLVESGVDVGGRHDQCDV